MLRPDIVAAAAAGRFRVYAIRHVDEGLQILSGRPAGERGADGEYPAASFNRLVEDRLRQLAERRRETRGDGDEADGDGSGVPSTELAAAPGEVPLPARPPRPERGPVRRRPVSGAGAGPGRPGDRRPAG
jgi:hypothetical protein